MGITWDGGTKPAKKRTNLTGLHIAELSIVDSPANVDSVITLAKRREDPQPPRVDPAAQRDALAALDRLIAKSRAATASHTPSLAETLAKACPARQNAAADEAHALAEQYADKNGCSYAQAYDWVAQTQPGLVSKAINGGDR